MSELVLNVWKPLFEGVWLFLMSLQDMKEKKISIWLLAIGGVACVISFMMEKRGLFFYLEAMLPGILLLAAALLKQAGAADAIVLFFLGYLEGSGKVYEICMVAFLLLFLFALTRKKRKNADSNTVYPFLPFLTVSWVFFLGIGR